MIFGREWKIEIQDVTEGRSEKTDGNASLLRERRVEWREETTVKSTKYLLRTLPHPESAK